jgi:hypothetical protein
MTAICDIEEIREQLEPKKEHNLAEAFTWFMVGIGVASFIAAELFIYLNPIR